MRPRPLIVSLAVVLSVLVPVQASQFVSLRTAVIWKAANDITDALLAAAVYRNIKAQINGNLTTAREQFWKEFPDGAGLESARRAYSQALIRKDYFNVDVDTMNEYLMDVQIKQPGLGSSVAGLRNMMNALEEGTGGRVEATHPLAAKEFQKWASRISTARLARPAEPVRPEDFTAGLPEYERYARTRDLAESLFFHPKSPLRSTTSTPEEYLSAWSVATGSFDSLEAATSYVATLRSDVGADKVARAARVLRSYPAVDVTMTRPGDSYAVTFLDHVTGRKRAEISIDPSHRLEMLKGVDAEDFKLRTRLYGLGEEAAVDRIRELRFRFYAADDVAAILQAFEETKALRQRVRTRFASPSWIGSADDPLTLRILDTKVAAMSVAAEGGAGRPAWDGIVKGEPLAPLPAGTDDRVGALLAEYRGPDEGTITQCLTAAMKGTIVVDGLPEGPITVIFNPGVKPVPYAVTSATPGHSRLVFTVDARETGCVAGRWVRANTSVEVAALAARTNEAFTRIRLLAKDVAEADAIQSIETSWRRSVETGSAADLQQAVQLKRDLLRRLDSLRGRQDRRPAYLFQAVEQNLGFIAPPYTGPRSGEIVWTGDTKGDPDIVVDLNKASRGKVQGALPGTKCVVEIVEPGDRYGAYIVEPLAEVTDFRRLTIRIGGRTTRVVLRWRVE